MSELTWITLPGGMTTEGKRRLSVLVLPRLDAGRTLAEHGLLQWPPRGLERLPLTAVFKDEAGLESLIELGPAPFAPQPGLWPKVFPPDIAVRGGARRRNVGGGVRVRPLATSAASAQATFAAVANAEVSALDDDHEALAAKVDSELDARWSGADEAALPALPPQTAQQPEPQRVPPDFNAKLAMLREHPAVLRALGLLFEIEVTQVVFERGLVKVRPAQALPVDVPRSVAPWTRYGTAFRPTSSGDLIDGGVLRLDKPRWQLSSFDVDGARQRLHDAARARIQPGEQRRTRAARDEALPVLRSNGLSLLMSRRQDDFDARLGASDKNAALASMDEAQLEADDLVLGLRFDVRPADSNDWFSLQRRVSRYSVADGTGEHVIAAAVEDEGHLKAHAVVDQGQGELQADDVLMRWDGWSLAVERPSFEQLPEPPQRQTPGLRCLHELSGRLPKLRFAQSYRLRARVADFAGNGLPIDDASDRGASSSVFYRRYQPIDPPRVAEPELTSPGQAPGEGIERVVLRSDVDLDAASFAQRHPAYRVHLARQLLPPRAPLALAEQHGAFDGMDAERSWLAVQNVLVPRDDDPAAADELRDFAAVGVQVHARREGDAPALADASRAWAADWPASTPMALRLQERRGNEPVLNWVREQGTDMLVVTLGKAQAITLEVSSQPKGDFLDHFAVRDHLSPASRSAVEQGRHPLVNPPNTIELMHAVRRPLRAPEAALALEPRVPGDTSITLQPLQPLLGADGASTARLELLASWSESVDGAVGLREMDAVSVQTLAIERGARELPRALSHDFGDTRRRLVRYRVRAHSRFRDCFADEESDAAFRVDSPQPVEIVVPSTARPSAPHVLDVVPAFRWRDVAVQGDLVAHRIREGGVLQVELKRPWFETGDDEQLAVIVAGSAPPPAQLGAYLTQCGSDPLFGGAIAPRFPSADLFEPDKPSSMVWLEEAQAEVGVLGFRTRLDGAHRVADVAIPKLAEQHRWPFVRLALARWQPHSLPRLALSPVIHSGFVQLWPRREVLVRRTANGFTVQVIGSPMGSSLVVERLHGASDPKGVDLSALTAPPPGIAAWVPLDGVSQFGVGSAIELRLPPGVTGPLRLRMVETGISGGLDAPIVHADIVDLPVRLNP
jgi:hypothetical protein